MRTFSPKESCGQRSQNAKFFSVIFFWQTGGDDQMKSLKTQVGDEVFFHKGLPDLVQQLENKLASIKSKENKLIEKINSELLPLKKQKHIFEKAIEAMKKANNGAAGI